MIRKIIISLISAGVIAGTILLAFAALYFIVPNRQSIAQMHLPQQVTDAEGAGDTTAVADYTTPSEEDNSDIYVADVYQSLTLRSAADSNATPLTEEGLAPLTKLEVQEFVPNTNFAYVQVLDGEHKDLFGYVNSEYITKLGEPTVRAVSNSFE